MIKIAYIIDTIVTPSAGTEKQLLYLLNNIDKNNFEVHLCCLYESDWMKEQSFDFKVHILNVNKILSLDYFRGQKTFAVLHQKYNFDIVQTFFRDGNIFGTLAASKAGVNKIVSSRRNVGYWHNRLELFILRRLVRKTDFYLANSKAAAEIAGKREKFHHNKIKVIYNGLELNKFCDIREKYRTRQRIEWGFEENNIVIGAVANLREVKRIDLLIKTASNLIKEYPDLRFIVVGKGELRHELQNLINSLGLKNEFMLVGEMENVESALSAFDIAVLPSSSESFSNSLLEYMAAGLPIVASDVGGNKEAIENNISGLFFGEHTPGAISKKLRYLLNNPDDAKKMAEIAKQRCFELFDLKKCVLNHQSFYKSIISSH